jgi:hypothetical protein
MVSPRCSPRPEATLTRQRAPWRGGRSGSGPGPGIRAARTRTQADAASATTSPGAGSTVVESSPSARNPVEASVTGTPPPRWLCAPLPLRARHRAPRRRPDGDRPVLGAVARARGADRGPTLQEVLPWRGARQTGSRAGRRRAPWQPERRNFASSPAAHSPRSRYASSSDAESVSWHSTTSRSSGPMPAVSYAWRAARSVRLVRPADWNDTAGTNQSSGARDTNRDRMKRHGMRNAPSRCLVAAHQHGARRPLVRGTQHQEVKRGAYDRAAEHLASPATPSGTSRWGSGLRGRGS